MTHLTVRTYAPRDFLLTEVSPFAMLSRESQDIADLALYHQEAGPAITVTDPNGDIVFCAGIHRRRWQGSGTLWAAFSPLAKKYLRTVWVAGFLVDLLYKKWGYERIEAVVNPEWPEAIRFVERLGFKRECIMRKYGPNGLDMALYALIGGR